MTASTSIPALVRNLVSDRAKTVLDQVFIVVQFEMYQII